MSKKNIVIAGAGFAGISCLRRLHRHKGILDKNGFKVILIDEKDDFEFIPMLPDVVGGWLSPERIRSPIGPVAAKSGAYFLRDSVKKISPAAAKIELKNSSLDYEYLVIAAGSRTNFFNKADLEKSCFKLDDIRDALRIKENLLTRAANFCGTSVVVVGGGYTGVEIATNILWFFRGKESRLRVTFIEKAADILMVVPEWMRRTVRDDLERLGFEIICGDSVKGYDGEFIECESNRRVRAHMVIWTAGVKASPSLDDFNADKERTRIKVEKTLRVKNPDYGNIFAAGDAASFIDGKTGQALRMAILFSMGQGKTAAENIVKSILKRPLAEYDPVDLGYLIPTAQGKAPGMVMGRRVGGLLGYLLHYYMCAYRSGPGKGLGVINDLIKKGGSL